MASQQYQHSVKTTTLFFKPIHSESLTDKLMIPRKFMKKYGDVFSETVFLKLPNGEEWKVNLGRRNNGDVWLQNGWREFADHHSLFKGRLLVFEYDDSTSHRLNVIIMDLTTSEEIDYPSNHNVEAKRARNEQQEESPCGTRKKNKKCKGSQRGRFNSKMLEVKGEVVKGNIGRALERAKAFKSQYPFFMIVARPYYVNASSQVAIPSKFGIKFLASEKSGQSTNLRTSNGRVWITKFITRKQGTKTRFELSTSGWKPFVKDNDLKVDDVCVFELIKGPTHHELNFRVSIFRNMNNHSDNAPLSQSQVCDAIERKSRDFLWGSSEEQKRMHLVSWDTVCKEKRFGGLGMKHIRHQNRAFMMKLGWGMVNDRDSLWVRVIRGKYGCGNDLLPRINPLKAGSNAWSGIKHNWTKVEEGIERVCDSNGNERVKWKWEKSGIFTVRSAYRSLSQPIDNPSSSWNLIWRLKIPQRCKTFAWLLMHGRLITNERKCRMNLHPTGLCERCNYNIENDLHAIRDCGAIRNFWSTIIHSKHHSRFFTGTTGDWMQLNLRQQIGPGKERWNNFFVIICWLLWQDRNEWVHSRISIGIDQVYPRALAVLESTTNALTKLSTVNLDINQRRSTVSEAENLEQMIEIEVDGAFSHIHRTAACGGIIMNTQGLIIEGFCLRLDSGDPLTAELWGCLMGLKRAWDGGHRNVNLRSDSQEALNLIQRDIPEFHEDRLVILEVQGMLSRNWNVNLQYIARERNTRADFLAKRALNDCPAKRKHTVTSGQGQKNKRVKIKTKTEDLQVPPKKPKFTKATFSKESSAAHSFNSENPFFKVTIGKSQHAQAVPISFVRKYWEQGNHFAELQVRDRSWRVKLIITCCGSQEYGFFSEGWVAFLRENDLQKEDACFFELLNRNDFYVMKVSIFKRSLT